MNGRVVASISLALGFLLTGTEVVQAQLPTLDLSRRTNYTSVTDRIFGNSSVSPYLSLLNEASVNGVPAYFTQVRPRQEMQEAARQQQIQLGRVQSQVRQTRRQINRAQREGGIFTTGHPTRFGNYSHYYQSLNRF